MNFCQKAAICYTIFILLANIWLYKKSNYTNACFEYIPPAIKRYLALLADSDFIKISSLKEDIKLEDKEKKEEKEEKIKKRVKTTAKKDDIKS